MLTPKYQSEAKMLAKIETPTIHQKRRLVILFLKLCTRRKVEIDHQDERFETMYKTALEFFNNEHSI